MLYPNLIARQILLVSLEMLVLFCFFLIVFIIIYRTLTALHERWFNRHYNRITEELLEMLTNSSPEAPQRLAARNRKYPAPLTHALLDLARRIKGPEREKLALVFKLVLEERTKKNLRSRFLLRRLTAARLLEFFSESIDPKLLKKLLQDKPPVRLAALSALANVPSPQSLGYLFQSLENDPSPNFQVYSEILLPLGEALEPELKKALARPLSPKILAFYIELIGQIPIRRLYPDLLKFIHHPEKEIRIKVTRAISRLEWPESFSVLMELARDPDWEVQAQAVLGLGRLKNPEAIPLLSQTLCSPHWYVRYNSKEALLMMGEEGLACLKKIAEQQSDRYAADMARMGLREYQEFYQTV